MKQQTEYLAKTKSKTTASSSVKLMLFKGEETCILISKIKLDNHLGRTLKSSKSSNVDPLTFLNQEIPFGQAEMKLKLHKG